MTSRRRGGSLFPLYTTLIIAGTLFATASAKYGIVRFAPSDAYEHPEYGPIQARECNIHQLILDYSANSDAEISVGGEYLVGKSEKRGVAAAAVEPSSPQQPPQRLKSMRSSDGGENRHRLGLDTGVFLMPNFKQSDGENDDDDDRQDHESSGEHHHHENENDHHRMTRTGSKSDHGPYVTSTTTPAPQPEIPTACTSLVISANSTTPWPTGFTTQTQFAITIERWSNGCFYVENLDVPGKDRITRACYDNGRFIPEMSVGRIGDDPSNPVAARGGIGFVIVVYPGYDTKNFRFWWTVDYPADSITGPLSAKQAESSNKHNNRPNQIRYDGRVVVTPYLVSAGQLAGGSSFECGRFIGTDFARCPGTGCLHLTFFCDGHFNCANTEVGDYDESWYICGYMLRAVILPTLSLLTLVLAALAAFYLLRRRRRMFAESSSPRAFRSGTESRRCSVHPLPLDASNLSSASAMNKAREAAASGNAGQDQRPRSSSGRSVSVECDVPDLVTPPGYEHPPDYQAAIFQVPPRQQQASSTTEGGGGGNPSV